MTIDFTGKEYRRLLDLVYIGNWILNSTRGEDRFEDYDNLESKLFSQCGRFGMDELSVEADGTVYPSDAYCEGGIHDAIMAYEDTVFFEILAEELSRRDMNNVEINADNFNELASRMDEYLEEFEQNGINNVLLDK